MNHQKIIDTLHQLLPEIKQASSAEDVLIKHATQNNLAPAQLERMGQIFNIAKTLNFMDKSANRGGSFKVLDLPKMMSNYTTYTPPTKQAVSDDWSSWFEDKATTKAASERMPDIMALARSPEGSVSISGTSFADGSANEMSYPLRTVGKLLEQVDKEAKDKFEVEATSQVIEDCKEQFRKIAEQLLDRIRMEATPFEEMEFDAIYHLPEGHGKSAADAFANYFQQKKWTVNRLPETHNKPKLVRDRHNAVELFKQAHETLGLLKAANQYKEYCKVAAAGADTKKDKKKKDLPGGPGNPDKEKGPRDKGKDIIYDIKDPYDQKKEKGNVKSSPIGDGLVKGVNELGKNIGPGAVMKTKDDILSKIKPKFNSRQKGIDSAINDEERVSTLQQLILTDPIISEADPKTVISLYNTLAESNEDVARDPNLLRFALREALQYDAVPMHTYKDLIEMQKSKRQAEKDSIPVEQSRYGG